MAKYRIRKLSASAIQTFHECRLKYYFRYFTDEVPIADPRPLQFGLAVHSALEFMMKKVKDGEPFDENIIKESVKEFHSQASFRQVISQELLAEGEKFLWDRLRRHNPNYKVIEVELDVAKFNLSTPNGTPLNGLMDLVLQIDENQLMVLDYKTSRKAKTQLEAKNDIQLSMYDYMASKLFPNFNKIWMALDYLRGDVLITDRSPKERQLFESHLDAVWEVMGKLTKDDVMQPTLNMYCPWCGYRHLCETYEGVLNSKAKFVPVIALSSEEQFVEEWEKVKLFEKIVAERKYALKEWANRYIDNTNKSVLVGEKSSVVWSQSTKKTYDPRVIAPHIPINDLVNLITFNKRALEMYVDLEHPELSPVLEQAMSSSPIAARLITKAN